MNSLDIMSNEITDNMNKLITLLEIDRSVKIIKVVLTDLNLCKVNFSLKEGMLTEIEVNRVNIVLGIMGWNIHKLRAFTFLEKRGSDQYWLKRDLDYQVYCNPQVFDQVNDLLKLTVDGVELTHYHLKHN